MRASKMNDIFGQAQRVASLRTALSCTALQPSGTLTCARSARVYTASTYCSFSVACTLLAVIRSFVSPHSLLVLQFLPNCRSIRFLAHASARACFIAVSLRHRAIHICVVGEDKRLDLPLPALLRLAPPPASSSYTFVAHPPCSRNASLTVIEATPWMARRRFQLVFSLAVAAGQVSELCRRFGLSFSLQSLFARPVFARPMRAMLNNPYQDETSAGKVDNLIAEHRHNLRSEIDVQSINSSNSAQLEVTNEADCMILADVVNYYLPKRIIDSLSLTTWLRSRVQV